MKAKWTAGKQQQMEGARASKELSSSRSGTQGKRMSPPMGHTGALCQPWKTTEKVQGRSI